MEKLYKKLVRFLLDLNSKKGNYMQNQKVLVFVVALLCMGFTYVTPDRAPVIDKNKLLERHNYYRDQVGVPHLEWSDELTEYAQKWADKLAKRCNMVHSKGPYGENIFWTSGSATEYEVVDLWASEKKYFNGRNPVYKKGKGSKYGHYTQMVWKETTHVGGAMQKCKHGGEIWVCSYSPHGNVIGKRVY